MNNKGVQEINFNWDTCKPKYEFKRYIDENFVDYIIDFLSSLESLINRPKNQLKVIELTIEEKKRELCEIIRNFYDYIVIDTVTFRYNDIFHDNEFFIEINNNFYSKTDLMNIRNLFLVFKVLKWGDDRLENKILMDSVNLELSLYRLPVEFTCNSDKDKMIYFP